MPGPDERYSRPAWFALLAIAGTVAIIATAAVLGHWFLENQLARISPMLTAVYPLRLRLQTMVELLGLIALFYLSCLFILNRLAPPASAASRYLHVALAFLPLMLTPAVGLGTAAVLTLAALLLVALAVTPMARFGELAGALALHLLALIAIALVTLISAEVVSPLNQADPLIIYSERTQGDLHIFAPVYKSYIWAKLFSFSDFDYSVWGMAPNVPTNLYSLPVQLFALLLDLPSVDVKSFHRLMAALVYVLFVAGSYGFYLFLRLGLTFRFLVALVGGLLFILGNLYFQIGFRNDYLFFVSAYALLPYALLALALAMRRGDFFAAAWSGFALALPFYILAPHPEATLHAVFFYACVALAWVFLPRKNPAFARRLQLLVVAAAVALAASAAHLAPIAETVGAGNLIAFGHQPGKTDAGAEMFLQEHVRHWLLVLPFIFLLASYRRRLSDQVPELWGASLAIVFLLITILLGDKGPIAQLLRTSGLPVNFIAPHRAMMYVFLGALIIAGYMLDTLQEAIKIQMPGLILFIRARLLKAKKRYAFTLPLERFVKGFLLGVVWLPVTAGAYFLVDSHGALKSGSRIGNPAACSYYITLAANLANMPNLSGDRANLEFLRDRLVAFEEDVALRRLPDAEIHAKTYSRIISSFGATTARGLAPQQILPAVRALARVVDDAMLDERGCVYPPMIDGDNLAVKWVIRYNNDALYQGLPGRHLRVMGATGRPPTFSSETKKYEAPLVKPLPRTTDSHLGLGAGLFVNNATTTVDSRFMMGYPLLHALYLYPGYHFERRGTYDDLMYWKFDAREVLQPAARRLFDIAGVDVVTVREEDLEAPLDFSGMQRLATDLSRTVDPRYAVLLNHRSYGMAYLANIVTYVDAAEADAAEKKIRDYFRFRLAETDYRSTVDSLSRQLLTLPGYRSVLIERPSGKVKKNTDTGLSSRAGDVAIEGIVGPSAYFQANCLRARCSLIFNMAALPGWRAYVDGNPTPVYRANYAFIAIEIEGGRHQVLFRYLPDSAVLGKWLTMGAVILLIVLNSMLPSGRSRGAVT